MTKRLTAFLVGAGLSVAAMAAMPGESIAHSNGWAFTKRQVFTYQGALRRAIQDTTGVYGVEVACAGEQPVRLRGGATGYVHIRCTTNQNIPDWVYHRGSRGQLIVTRGW